MKLDLSKFSQAKQELRGELADQESSLLNQGRFQQRGSVSSNKTSRRQGTPVSQVALTANTN
jgi:hypothetical protein